MTHYPDDVEAAIDRFCERVELWLRAAWRRWVRR